ncbi:MAG: DnaB-like helicase C-terminal domain-containing protein [Candidatus Pacearchaeota archaeon]
MLHLIKLLCIHSIYIKYNTIIYDLIKNNKELNTLYKYITVLINKYERDITYEELTLYVLTNIIERDREKFSVILQNLQEQNISSEVFDDLLLDLVQKHKAHQLAISAVEVSEGRKSFSDLLLLTQDLNSTTALLDPLEDHSNFVTDNLNELYNETIHKPGLRWRLNALNRSLGSLRKGDFGFIFARPESGKTTFLASEVSYFAEQSSSSILWFNNEEQGSKVQLRIYQASLGRGLLELFGNRDKYQNEYSNKTGNRIKVFDSAAITKTTVESSIITHKPACIIFDQLDKIQGFSGDREDLRLGDIYIWARELAKKYCPVIGVCQSDASGEGKRWLTMDNVANAKTAKQAEADWIIGIGKTHNESEEYQRFLSICKNKLMGDEDTEPMLRHGHLTVKIKPDIARYED